MRHIPAVYLAYLDTSYEWGNMVGSLGHACTGHRLTSLSQASAYKNERVSVKVSTAIAQVD